MKISHVCTYTRPITPIFRKFHISVVHYSALRQSDGRRRSFAVVFSSFSFSKTFPFRFVPRDVYPHGFLCARGSLSSLEDSLRATNNVKRRLQHPGVSRVVPNHSRNYVILLVGETPLRPRNIFMRTLQAGFGCL